MRESLKGSSREIERERWRRGLGEMSSYTGEDLEDIASL